MDLKSYQRATLDTLDNFLSAAKLLGVSRAFDKFRRAEGYDPTYRPLPNLADAPFVCLRLPTGGGKTFRSCCGSCRQTKFVNRRCGFCVTRKIFTADFCDNVSVA